MIAFIKRHIKIIQLFISIVLLVYLFLQLDAKLEDFLDTIVDLKYVLLALLCSSFLLPLISANRWNLFLKNVGVNEKFSSLLQILYKAMFLGFVLPSSQGNDFVRIYMIEKKHPEKKGYVGSTIIIERVMGLLLLIFYGFVASFFLPAFPSKNIIIAILGLLLFTVLFLFFLLKSSWVNKLLSRISFQNNLLKSIVDYTTRFQKSLLQFSYKKVLLSSLLVISIFQLTTILIVFFVFKSCDINISFVSHLAMYPIVCVITMIPISLNGLGLREGSFAYFYSLLGVDPIISVTVSIMCFVVLSIIPALIGGGIFIIQKISK